LFGRWEYLSRHSTASCNDVTNGAGQVLYEWCCQPVYVFWLKVDKNCGTRDEMR
jgi:hypothetical protein